MPGVAIARRRSETQPGEALEQDRQGDLHFEAGERRADAEMDARPEGDVGQERPRRVEATGVGVARRVAVGRAEEKADLLALVELDAGDLDRLERITIEEMKRRIEA